MQRMMLNNQNRVIDGVMIVEVFCNLYYDFEMSYPCYAWNQLVSPIVSVLGYLYSILVLYSSYMHIK